MTFWPAVNKHRLKSLLLKDQDRCLEGCEPPPTGPDEVSVHGTRIELIYFTSSGPDKGDRSRLLHISQGIMGMLMNKSGRFRWLARTMWCRFWIFLLSTSSGLMILDCWTLVEVCAPPSAILVLDAHPDLNLSLSEFIFKFKWTFLWQMSRNSLKVFFQISGPEEHAGRTEQTQDTKTKTPLANGWPWRQGRRDKPGDEGQFMFSFLYSCCGFTYQGK